MLVLSWPICCPLPRYDAIKCATLFWSAALSYPKIGKTPLWAHRGAVPISGYDKAAKQNKLQSGAFYGIMSDIN